MVLKVVAPEAIVVAIILPLSLPVVNLLRVILLEGSQECLRKWALLLEQGVVVQVEKAA